MNKKRLIAVREEQVTVKYYKFDELSDEAKERAIQDYAEFEANENIWWEFLIDDYTEKIANELGLNTSEVKISFSLSYSQGDYAHVAIDGNYLNDTLLKAVGIEVPEEYKKYVYECVRLERPDKEYADADVDWEDYADEDEMQSEEYVWLSNNIDKIAEAFDTYFDEKDDEIYHALDKEWDYITSEEQVQETSEANGWEYDEDGKMI